MELVGANAFLARGHERISLEPNMKLDMAAFDDRLGGHGKVLPALFGMAAPDARLLGGVMVANCPAMRTNGIASPTEGFEIFASLIGILKLRGAEHDYLL